MAATVSDVKAINGSTVDDTVLQPFLDAAVCIMQGQIVAACLTARQVTETCKDAATAWLAAHLFAMTSVGQSTAAIRRETFENYTVERAMSQVVGGGVLSTTYGQTANTITGGCLVESDKAPAGVAFFG